MNAPARADELRRQHAEYLRVVKGQPHNVHPRGQANATELRKRARRREWNRRMRERMEMEG